MQLIPENKTYIDNLTYKELLAEWRFAASGSEWFQGETGKYWDERMRELKAKDPTAAVQASKDVGWR